MSHVLCMVPHGVRVIKITIYRFYVRMWLEFRSSLLHQTLAQHQLSRLRPILPETFHYANGSIESVWSQDNDQENVVFVFLDIYIFWNVLPASVEQSFERDDGTPARRGKLWRHRLAGRSAVEERHCPRHHWPRALRKVPVSERQTPAWTLWR